jgi:hypothetical protein
VLRSAARYLERYGWIQGAYYDATSRVFTPAACMVGAIGMVCYGGPVEAPAQHFDDPGYLDFEEAVLHLDRYLMVEDESESYQFNDAKDRQLADVLRVLRQAADTSADELIDTLHALNIQNACRAELYQPDAHHLVQPHTPGFLEACPACESVCQCTSDMQCVHCDRVATMGAARLIDWTELMAQLNGGDAR